MNFWIPESLYKIKPLMYLLAAFFILVSSDNFAFIIVAVGVINYSAYICWMRFKWDDNSRIS